MSPDGTYQNMGGRIARLTGRDKELAPPNVHRDVGLTKRWMDAMGIDVICLFPTPMLTLGAVPRREVENELAMAYGRWLCDKVLSVEPRIRSMLYLPFNDPAACIRMVEELGDRKGIIGFMVTAPHRRGNYENEYMRLYAMLQERNLPIGFHGSYTWHEPTFATMNRFISVHALGFSFFNMVHMANWVMNAHPRALPQAQGGVDRERARLGPVRHAAARQRVHDAHVRGAGAQAQAERLHARHVLHDAADGDGRERRDARRPPSR